MGKLCMPNFPKMSIGRASSNMKKCCVNVD